uniref:Uncharacterized protein n=1 Tax=Ditylenchus dipsaci TaxID=166011 RepID=A0A915CWY4_9BILA
MRLKISNFGASLALIFVFFIGIVHSFEMADVVSLTDKWVEIVNVGKGFLEKATDISETNTLFAEALIPVAAAVALAKKIGTDAESKELIAIDQLRSVLVHDIGELKDVVVDEKYAAIYRDALDKFDEKVTLPIIKTITSIVAVLDPNVIDSSSDEKELLKQCPNVMDIYQYLEHVVERHCAKSNFPTKESKQVQASALAFFHKLEADKFVNYEPQMAGHKEYQVMKSSKNHDLHNKIGLNCFRCFRATGWTVFGGGTTFLSGLQELVSSLPLAKYSNLSQFRHDFLDKTSTLSFNRDDIGPECMLLAVENNSHHDRDTMTDLVKHMTYHLAQVEVLQIVCIYKLYNLEADRLHKVDEFKDKIAKTMKATRKWVETSLALDFPAIFVKYAKQVATATKLEDENEYNRIAKAVNNRLSKLGLPDYHFQVLVSQADDELQTTHLAHNEARNFAVREHKGLNIL